MAVKASQKFLASPASEESPCKSFHEVYDDIYDERAGFVVVASVIAALVFSFSLNG